MLHGPPPHHRPSRVPSFAARWRATTAEAPLVYAGCGRQPRDDENAADEWRAYAGVDDELHVFCPDCAEREFGSD